VSRLERRQAGALAWLDDRHRRRVAFFHRIDEIAADADAADFIRP
jgi:hypothetical protein